MNSNNVNSVSRLVKNGGSETKVLQSFLSLLILGYFGIKIVYGGFFHFYPDKYYYRSVDIQTNESGELSGSNTEKIALNSFMPGMWNNEITDFVSFMILAGIIFVFTHVPSQNIFQSGGMVDSLFVIGFLIGLTFPVFYQNIKNSCQMGVENQCTKHNSIVLVMSIVILIILIFIQQNVSGKDSKSNYFIYLTAITLLIIGLFYTRKLSKTYQKVTYYKNNEDKCTYKNTGYVYSSGDQLLITPAFASWILLFFFGVEPSNASLLKFVHFLFGMLFGIFTSSMSYYGIDYFLMKVGEKSCNSVEECKLKDMPRPPEDTKTADANETVSSNIINLNLSTNHIPTMRTVLIVFIVLMMFYFLYFQLKMKK